MHDPLSQFPCSMCGECCRHIDQIPQLAAFDDGTGACKYLHGNKCSIYPDRPEICNIDAMYEKVFKALYPDKETYYRMNRKACELLQNEGTID